MSTYVLVHGAWHGGWCWDKVVPLLEKKGHKGVASGIPVSTDKMSFLEYKRQIGGEMELSGNVQKGEPLPEMWLRPVGVVRNRIKEPSLVAESGDLELRAKVEKEAREERRVISELVIDSNLAGILDGIESFSHLLVLFWAHRVPPEGRSLIRAHPMGRKDFPLVGIFATASPARPNPICVATVRLLERRANVLRVEGLDAIDGSPLVDIKPYVPCFYAATDANVADWMIQVVSEYYE